jgi:peptidoglycan/LPS O-acetylase OafA/YrhL
MLASTSLRLRTEIKAGESEWSKGLPGDAASFRHASTRLFSLDGLRGIAAILVVSFHALGYPSGGYFGVDLFFVLSGFLISSQILSETDRTGRFGFMQFFKRRFLRLIPGFLIMYALYCGIRFCFMPDLPNVGPRRLLQILFLSNVIILELGYNPVTFLSHLWSISVEWQFYLVWPFLLVMLLQLGCKRRILFTIILTFAAISELLRIRSTLPSLHVDGLLLGSAIALASERGWAITGSSWPRVFKDMVFFSASVAFALLTILSIDGSWSQRFGLSLASWLAATIVSALVFLKPPLAEMLLASTLLRYLGRNSYGIYLFHYPIFCIMFVSHFERPKIAVVVVVVSIVLADFSERYIETPVRRIGAARRSAADLQLAVAATEPLDR